MDREVALADREDDHAALFERVLHLVFGVLVLGSDGETVVLRAFRQERPGGTDVVHVVAVLHSVLRHVERIDLFVPREAVSDHRQSSRAAGRDGHAALTVGRVTPALVPLDEQRMGRLLLGSGQAAVANGLDFQVVGNEVEDLGVHLEVIDEVLGVVLFVRHDVLVLFAVPEHVLFLVGQDTGGPDIGSRGLRRGHRGSFESGPLLCLMVLHEFDEPEDGSRQNEECQKDDEHFLHPRGTAVRPPGHRRASAGIVFAVAAGIVPGPGVRGFLSTHRGPSFCYRNV